MEFFTFIVTLGQPELHKLYPSFIKLAMKWAPVEQVKITLKNIFKMNLNVEINNFMLFKILDIFTSSVIDKTHPGGCKKKQFGSQRNRRDPGIVSPFTRL